MKRYNTNRATRYIKAVIAKEFELPENKNTSRYHVFECDFEGLRYKNLESGKNYTKSPTPNNWRIKNV